MGYTHYFAYRPDSEGWAEAWPTLCADVGQIITASTVPLAGGDGHGAPEIDRRWIRLNGRGEQSHETFLLWGPDGAAQGYAEYRRFAPDAASEDRIWSFCKTAEKPYDVVVGAALIRAAQLGGLVMSSDGFWEREWEEPYDYDLPGARPLVRRLFGTDALPVRAQRTMAGEISCRQGLDLPLPIDPAEVPPTEVTSLGDALFD